MSLSSSANIAGWLLRRGRRGRTVMPRKLHRFQPRLEALEDRLVPSTIMVTKTADDLSAGTLRWAVNRAKSGDTILLFPDQPHQGPIVLTQGEIGLNYDLTIKPFRDEQVSISSVGDSEVFDVGGQGTVLLENLAISGGDSSSYL